MKYTYGMKLRGFSIGCQPNKGFVERKDDTSGKYHDLIVYDRELSEEELNRYSLELVEGERPRISQKLYSNYIGFRKAVDSGTLEIYDWENDESLLDGFNQELWENAEEGDQIDIGKDAWLELNEMFKKSGHSKPGLEIAASKNH